MKANWAGWNDSGVLILNGLGTGIDILHNTTTCEHDRGRHNLNNNLNCVRDDGGGTQIRGILSVLVY